MSHKSIAAALAATAASCVFAAEASAAIEITGLTDGGTGLVSFPADKPQRTSEPVAISGLAADEIVVGIDRRPRNGELYAVTSGSRLLVVNPDTGVSTLRATLSVPLSGLRFGVDFNPTVDRLRIVSDADQNLRVNPDTGAAIVDGNLAYAAGDVNAGVDPTIAGAAYTNNDSDFIATPTNPAPASATRTELFDLDAALGVLSLQNPPNAGTLASIGPVGGSNFREVGLDNFSAIVDGRAATNVTYASLGKGGTEKLYTINRMTGDATLVGPFGSQGIADIAVPIDGK